MSVEKDDVIDIISIDKDDNIVLTISDHLKWDRENEHLLILQNKINYYLAAIEGGDLVVKYPDAVNRRIIIRVIAQYNPNKDGELFLGQVKNIVTLAGYGFEFKVYQGNL